nr:hypothetical protein [Lachnospiraceae bacterium]
MQTQALEKIDEKYRWRYQMSLYRNPSIFVSTAKAIFIAVVITVLLMGVIMLITAGFDKDNLLFLGKLSLILLGIFAVLLVLGYLIYAMIMGGYYIVDFVMDSEQLIHAQSAKQAKKAEKISRAAVIMGALTGNRGAMSAGMLSAGRSVSVTEFSRVKKVVVNRRRSVIKLWSGGWNAVYADGPDLDFVADWIRAHVPETAEWTVK